MTNSVMAKDEPPIYGQTFGHGLISCKDYRKSIRASAKTYTGTSDYVKVWADGYLTGMDMIVAASGTHKLDIKPFKKDGVVDLSPNSMEVFRIRDKLWDELNDYCKANLKDTVEDAVDAYANKWYPEHIVPLLEGEEPIVQLPLLGAGNHTCREYTRSLPRPGKYITDQSFAIVDLAGGAETWLQGFVSFVSQNMAENGIVPPKLPALDGIKKLKKYCASNPDSKIIAFAGQYVDEYLVKPALAAK